MQAKPLPSINRLREDLTYNPDTGEIMWAKPRTGVTVGAIAGSVCKHRGYRRINIYQQMWPAHRIAWALHYGVDPHPLTIDHINRDKTDNRITNLRTATQSEQNRNRDNTRIGRRSAMRIAYPDGGTITARSQTLAAWILNMGRRTLCTHLRNGGVTPTGITIAYAE
jgi:hypothetical protein